LLGNGSAACVAALSVEQFQAPAGWSAAPLLKLCCRALLMSFADPDRIFAKLTPGED
jgi:hypothetical protein